MRLKQLMILKLVLFVFLLSPLDDGLRTVTAKDKEKEEKKKERHKEKRLKKLFAPKLNNEDEDFN